MKGDALDPSGLIAESYRIAGITASECRTIFLDWALKVPSADDVRPRVIALLAQYAAEPEDHPMTQTLRAALKESGPARRRGGRSGRLS